jgi:RNA polymerase sigma factor (sigma-70 family)
VTPPDKADSDPEQLFLSALPILDRIIAIQARRHGLSAADAEDYASWLKTRLIVGEYVVFRKFGGRSSLATYLTAVLFNLFREYRNRRWGRWRPSAAAKRLGPVAVRLEELLYREGRSIREASALLIESGVPLRESEIVRLSARLPARVPARETSLESDNAFAANVPDPSTHPVALDDTAVVESALRSALDELGAEDALILRMRFWNDMSVADIARLLRLDQKALYRRLEGLRARLRVGLAERGIDRAWATEVLHRDPT